MTIQEKKDRATAANRIQTTEWFHYTNVPLSLNINIKRSLIDNVAKRCQIDFLDACAAVANIAKPHAARLRRISLGQSEAHITTPFVTTWHVCTVDDVLYLSDQAIIPYRCRNSMAR